MKRKKCIEKHSYFYYNLQRAENKNWFFIILSQKFQNGTFLKEYSSCHWKKDIYLLKILIYT